MSKLSGCFRQLGGGFLLDGLRFAFRLALAFATTALAFEALAIRGIRHVRERTCRAFAFIDQLRGLRGRLGVSELHPDSIESLRLAGYGVL